MEKAVSVYLELDVVRGFRGDGEFPVDFLRLIRTEVRVPAADADRRLAGAAGRAEARGPKAASSGVGGSGAGLRGQPRHV